jgi:hypothetical protein
MAQAALFANTWAATDSIVRPEPLGATAILQIRSAEAPRSFSWEARLGPDQQLKQLSDGSVAVVNTPEGAQQPGESQEPSGTPQTEEGQPETTAEQTQGEHEQTESTEREAKGESETEVPLTPLPAAPTSSAASGESAQGEPQPQATQPEYEAGETAVASAEAQTAGQTLMVIRPPAVTDAAGTSIPATLSVTGEKITLTVKPGSQTVYPALASLAVAAKTATTSAEPDHARYGLTDDIPGTFAKAKENPNGSFELEEPKGKPVSVFDPNLSEGHGKLHVVTARLIIPYDVFFNSQTQDPTRRQRLLEEWGEKRLGEWSKKLLRERTRLAAWLKAVRIAGAHGQALQPYITLGPDGGCPELGSHKTEAEEKRLRECSSPSRTRYREGVSGLIRNDLPVKLWGAWNEPDATPYLSGELHRAAEYWQIAQYVAAHHRSCAGCKIIAGEFAFKGGFNKGTFSQYRNAIVEPHKLCGFCSRARPSVWGFHDYHDVVYRTGQSLADAFFQITGSSRSGKARLWISEAAVELQSGGKNRLPLVAGTKAEQKEKQEEAATEFEHLHRPSRVDRIYYDAYRAPTEGTVLHNEAEEEPPPWDSGLLEAEPEGDGRPPRAESHGEARPAYCRLAFANHSCIPTVTTLAPETGQEIRASIDANGLNTTVVAERVEPGQTTWTKLGAEESIGHGVQPIPITPLGCETNQERAINKVTAPVRYAATNAAGTTYSNTETYHWCRLGGGIE